MDQQNVDMNWPRCRLCSVAIAFWFVGACGSAEHWEPGDRGSNRSNSHPTLLASIVVCSEPVGDSEQAGRCCEALAMADLRLPAALGALLASLESRSPSLSALPPPESSWGSYFLDDQETLSASRRRLRLRIMTAIGKCRSVRNIELNPKDEQEMYSVSVAEAKALLKGLKSNQALESLSLCWFKGFGTTEACAALAAAVLRPSRSLEILDMRGLELSVAGLGHLSAALRDNGSGSVLRELYLDDNNIGNAAGALHVARILTHSRVLRNLGLYEIGMDVAGATVIADAVARSASLNYLGIGFEGENPEEAAMLIPLLRSLNPLNLGVSPSWQSPSSYNPKPSKPTMLFLSAPGLPGKVEGSAVEAGLAEAVAGLLLSNTLEALKVSSYFVRRGLWALALNSSIKVLILFHPHSLDEEELDPLLMETLQQCEKLEELHLRFREPYGPSKFSKELFQGLKHNCPSVKELVLDGWDGLDDEMFEDLILSLSTNTKLEHISIKGTSWERQGKGERLAKVLRDRRLEPLSPNLLALLAELESSSPTLQDLPSVDSWGHYFNCNCQDEYEKCEHRGEWQWEVRLRLLTAIGRCRTLRRIDLNPEMDHLRPADVRSVRQVEAVALLSGLQDNLVLEELTLVGYKGFATTVACLQALSAVIDRSYRSLYFLNLKSVGLSAEGLGYIAAALGRNGTSVLCELDLCGNDIGNAVGAQHLGHILSTLSVLRSLFIADIRLDEEGSMLIAEALAHNTTLSSLYMGVLGFMREQAAPMFIIPLLEALVWSESSHPTASHQTLAVTWSHEARNPLAPAPFNHSITTLFLECPGGQEAVEPGLGEALAGVIRSNRALRKLFVPSFFVTRGLGALRENSCSITILGVSHNQDSDDDDMDPMLITILQECRSVQELRLWFQDTFGPCKFTKALFQGLQNNRSIKTLVLDGWKGLDDDMFHDLMRSMGPNNNNVLENISIKNTSWESEGKAKHIQDALTKSIRKRSSAGRQGSSRLPPPVPMAPSMPADAVAAGIPVPVSEHPDRELLALIADLGSPSPTIHSLPFVEAVWQLFEKDIEHPEAKSEMRLRLMTAIGNCPTLRSIDLYSLLGHGSIGEVTEVEATALLEGLSSNSVLESLGLGGHHVFGTAAVCSTLTVTLRSSRTLQYLDMKDTGMTADGLGCIAEALRDNRSTVLRRLGLSGNPAIGNGVGAEHLADILTTTPTLLRLGIWEIGMDDAGAVVIGNALAQNTTLLTLDIGCGVSVSEDSKAGVIATLLARAFTPGMPDAEQETQGLAPRTPSVNKSVTYLRLHILGASVQQPVPAALGEAAARMLRCNMTFKHLSISSCFISRGLEGLCDNRSITRIQVPHYDASSDEDYCNLMTILRRCQTVERLHLFGRCWGSGNFSKTFFKSLQDNRYLKVLKLEDWEGLDDHMSEGLMEALHVNTILEQVSLTGTVWEREGKGALVDEVLRQNREYRRALAGAPTMPVKSCRLVLCGFPYAGKTTIRNTLMGMETDETGFELEGKTLEGETSWERIPRTRGFEISVIKDAPTLRVTIWDLAGHKEYHALHDFIFPNVNNSSFFLFVYNPFKLDDSTKFKDEKAFREEFTYWVKFIASNSKAGRRVKPYVYVVVTFADKFKEGDWYTITICEEMAKVKKQFVNLVETSDGPAFINGQSWEQVFSLQRDVEKKLGQLVQRLPPIPNICEQTRMHVQRWAAEQQGMPIISVDEFKELFHDTCRAALRHPFISEDYRVFLMDFMVKDYSWKVVASYLKDSGEVIYFQMSDLMVVNLQWLGMGVFSELINIFGDSNDRRTQLQVQNGFISKHGLSMLLRKSLDNIGLSEAIVSDDEERFINLMLELHLCYKSKDEEGEEGYPCVHTEEIRQVLLYDYGLKKRWIDKDDRSTECRIRLQPNVISISVEFLNIFIELNTEVGCYVDILTRSTAGYLRSLNFVETHIVSQIRSFCSSDQGCAGVTLVQGVLRRECVVSLTSCRDRKHQCVLTNKLVEEVDATKRRGDRHFAQSWGAIPNSTEGQPPILKENIEWATMVGGHIILGRKEDLVKAEAEFQESKSNRTFSGEIPTELSLKVKAVQKVQHIAGSYPSKSVESGERRGLAVIVSMEEGRPGGAGDRGRLEGLLKTLKFDTESVVRPEDIETRLGQLVKFSQLADDDCFVCCINAHGGIEEDGRHYILMSGQSKEKPHVLDDSKQKLYVLDLLKPITECKHLANKPKVFLINACRGTGSLGTSNKAERSDVEGSQAVSKTAKRAGEVRPLTAVSDCLFVFSTSHGEVSFRDPEEGSNFIKAFVDAIAEFYQTADLLSILTRTIGEVTTMGVEQEIEGGNGYEMKFQCPELYSSLTKGLYWSLPPGQGG